MTETRMEKTMKPVPVPYEEFESFPKHVEEFFDMIARRPFELLEKRPLFFGRELDHLFRAEPEFVRPILLKLYETEEHLIVRAEVPVLRGEDQPLQEREAAVRDSPREGEGRAAQWDAGTDTPEGRSCKEGED